MKGSESFGLIRRFRGFRSLIAKAMLGPLRSRNATHLPRLRVRALRWFAAVAATPLRGLSVATGIRQLLRRKPMPTPPPPAVLRAPQQQGPSSTCWKVTGCCDATASVLLMVWA